MSFAGEGCGPFPRGMEDVTVLSFVDLSSNELVGCQLHSFVIRIDEPRSLAVRLVFCSGPFSGRVDLAAS